MKPTALIRGSLHQLLAELDAALRVGGEQERERAGVQVVGGDGAADRAGDQLAGARVSRVALDDDRAAGGQRGRGVPAGGGEGEREVAGPEDRDRAEGDLALPEVGARQRRPVRQGGVDADAEVVAASCDGGEHPQLAGGATDLARDAGLRQVALGDGRLDDRVPVGLDLVGDGVEERAALLGGGGAVGRERLGGRGGRGGDVGLTGLRAGDDRAGLLSGAGHAVLSMQLVVEPVETLQEMRAIRSRSSATSESRRSVSGGRTGPAGRPMAARPPLTMETA